MEKCPFCGKEVPFSYPFLMKLEQMNKWSFSHNCTDSPDSPFIFISAPTKEKVFEIWNTRN